MTSPDITVPPDLFRVYQDAGQDGYPPEWHYLAGPLHGIKHIVRAQADHRCLRCKHPYVKGEGAQWSACGDLCEHSGPIRYRFEDEPWCEIGWISERGWQDVPGTYAPSRVRLKDAKVEAEWRILTVHHLNGVKLDCRWWNLASLCQRCHLIIQGKVKLERAFIREHSEWFKPFAAGWYAHRYLHEDITREEAVARMDELLGLELREVPLF